MPEFIYQLSSVSLFLFLITVLVSISLAALLIVRKYIALEFRYKENTAIVSCSALLGIIYAVLVGFIILYQFGSFDKAEKSENTEGVLLHSIYHNSKLLSAPHNTNLQTLVIAYAKNAVDYEWPALNASKKINANGRIIIENMVKEIQSINAVSLNKISINLITDLQQEIGQLFKEHHQRTAIILTILNGHTWFVILLATLFTFGINFFLGMEFRLHIFCLALIATILSSIIYLIVGLDRPYQGDFAVHPDTIETVLEEKI